MFKRSNKNVRRRNAPRRRNNNAGLRTVSQPVRTSVVVRNTGARINGTNGRIRVAHRECIAAVTGKIAFNAAQVFALNPGLASTFPWLSGIAARYNHYKFKRLVFRFVSGTSTSITGELALVPVFDAADPAPASWNVAMQSGAAVSTPVWKNVSINVLKDQFAHTDDEYYVRSEALSSNLDIKTYDVGNLFVCVQGQAADDGHLGQLYVDYIVDFTSPHIDAGF
jgi:hypothetical protein